MANDEHVAMLKKGVDAWNQWRREKPFKPDLSGADLGGAYLGDADLSEADLSGANLNEAYLRKADLDDADLGGASLYRANLSGASLYQTELSDANLSGADLRRATLFGTSLGDADLSGASLQEAHLRDAYLRGADLSGANLQWTYLNGTNLKGANLADAVLLETVFGFTDLSEVKGLDQCEHEGASVVDFFALGNSGLPTAFLRGVGLPDTLIDHLPSLLHEAIQFHSCFISYSSKDLTFAERLYADLQNKGVRCWFAPHDMAIGAKIIDSIDEGVRLRDKVLLILSEGAVASDWVEGEVTRALDEERTRKQLVLFPVRIDDAVMRTSEAWARLLRGQRNIGDFTNWKEDDSYQKSFGRLMRDLRLEREGGR